MEQLQSFTIDIPVHGQTFHCTLRERDFGDYIVYDVSSEGKYLVTLSRQGEVLFNESSMGDKPPLPDPNTLNELVDHLRSKISAGLR